MNRYDLSILIPGRNEMFLSETVQNILKNKRGKTEIIVGCDGNWPDPPVESHPDVTLFFVPQAIGQRAITNQACRLSTAKYVMKLDAHCALDEGFDIKLLADMQDDWTMIPTLYNLHGFDWVCIGKNVRSGRPYEKIDWFKHRTGCGFRKYQSPTPQACPECGGNMERQLVFKPRFNKRSFYYRFDRNLHFQYWGSYEDRIPKDQKIVDIFSAQGSCFLLTRQKYWELNICDEAHGSWGQQGVEVACKTWLSGGRLVTNKNTWYSHMFRTQGGDFGFPYPLSGSDQEKARQYSKSLWLGDKWPQARHSFDWLIEKFKPIPEWHEVQPLVSGNTTNKGIIFYTDNQVKLKIAHRVQKNLLRMGLPIVSTSLKPMDHFGRNFQIKLPRGYLTMFKQILKALEESRSEIIFFCEHDVIYHPSHFEFTPPKKDKFYYDLNWWKVWEDGFVAHWDANQVAMLCCYREYAIKYYRERVDELENKEFNRSYEPGGRDKTLYENWRSAFPSIDIRTGKNLTRSHRSIDEFRDKTTAVNWQESSIEKIPGWNLTLQDIF